MCRIIEHIGRNIAGENTQVINAIEITAKETTENTVTGMTANTTAGKNMSNVSVKT
jgi:hypothetical protein